MSSEILEKQHFSTDSVACGCCSKTASQKTPPGGNTMPLKDELVPKPRQKNAQPFVWNPRKNSIFRQISTDSVACGCCSKTASKKSPLGGKHHASEGRASSKTTPKNCLTCRLKSEKNSIFRQILLPAAAGSKTASKKSLPGGGNTMPLKDELVPKPRQKTG